MEHEQPFGDDTNDLQLIPIQEAFNEELMDLRAMGLPPGLDKSRAEYVIKEGKIKATNMGYLSDVLGKSRAELKCPTFDQLDECYSPKVPTIGDMKRSFSNLAITTKTQFRTKLH